MEPISEETVKGVADICGPHSAAAKALKDAGERRARGEEVAFFQSRSSIIVVGIATKEDSK